MQLNNCKLTSTPQQQKSINTMTISNENTTIRIGRKQIPPVDSASKVPLSPTSVQLALTEACPMRCIHCDLWQTKNQHLELSTSMWKHVIDDLGCWLMHRDLHFTGGEPFLRKDFLELVRYAKSQHNFCISANTSGVMITESILDKVIEAGFNGLIFSIDGVDGLHGKIRGNNKVFEQNLKTMEALRHHMFVSIATVIMEPNLDEFCRLIDFAIEVGAAGIGFQPLFQNFGADRDPEWFKKSPIWPKDPDHVVDVLDAIISRKESGAPVLNSFAQLNLFKHYFHSPLEIHEYRCLVGETNLAISPYGDVRLCYQMDPVGNVTEAMPSEIWTNDTAAFRRDIINQCNRSCSIMNCNFNEI